MSVLPPLLLLMGLEENLGGERKLCPNYQLLGAKHTEQSRCEAPHALPLPAMALQASAGMRIKNQPSQKREEQQGTGSGKSQHSCWEDGCLE